MRLVDTHCHIQEASYPLVAEEVLERAHRASVDKMIAVGTNLQSSREALAFAHAHEHVWASIGVHPHDTVDGVVDEIVSLAQPSSKLVAVGEIGLDYFYSHSPRLTQIAALEVQLQLAYDRQLPVIFHVREAFEDFWPVFDTFSGVKGVLHSFTDTSAQMQAALQRGLYIGVNGISTFTKDEQQKAMFVSIPTERLLLETDAPFLTPVPFRGKVNEPSMVSEVAKHHANIRKVSLDEIAHCTSTNAETLFGLVA